MYFLQIYKKKAKQKKHTCKKNKLGRHKQKKSDTRINLKKKLTHTDTTLMYT